MHWLFLTQCASKKIRSDIDRSTAWRIHGNQRLSLFLSALPLRLSDHSAAVAGCESSFSVSASSVATGE